jgi:hypothetical protein
MEEPAQEKAIVVKEEVKAEIQPDIPVKEERVVVKPEQEALEEEVKPHEVSSGVEPVSEEEELFVEEAVKKFEFKEPTLLWEREFEQPLKGMSDLNSNGEYIAIEFKVGTHGRKAERILFLDNKGDTVREIPMGGKEKRQIPAKEVWLTHYGEATASFKKSFTMGKEITTITDEVFISGNGEFYGMVTGDTAIWETGPESDSYISPWYEFNYYDKRGKLLWSFIPEENYGFKEAHISHDGKRVLVINEAHLDYFAQSWYFFDENGRLIKSEDHILTGKHGEERFREVGEYIKELDISVNGRYFGYVKGMHDNSKAGVMDRNGRILWEKSFEETHFDIFVANNGSATVDGKNTFYSIDKEGNLMSEIARGSVPVRPISNSGKRVVTEGGKASKEAVRLTRIYDAFGGDLILKFKFRDILEDPEEGKTYKAWRVWFTGDDQFIFIIYYSPDSVGNSMCIFSLEDEKIIWKKEGLGKDIRFKVSQDESRLIVFDAPDEWIDIKKVMVFDLGGE